MLPPHLVRFGSHNEQVHFKGDLSTTYDGLAFNANLVAWSATGIAGFICGSDLVDKPYFIDPLTHSFQHDVSALTDDDGNVKKSIQSLVAQYGEPLASTVGDHPVTVEDFDDDELREAFTRRVLEFQRDTLHEEAEEEDTWDYLTFVYGDELDLRPDILVAPYFYMNEATFDYWIDLNVEFANLAANLTDQDVAAQLVIGRGILDNGDIIDDTIEKYNKEVDLDNVLLWIDGFSEHTASKEDLETVRKLCSGLANAGIEVHNLYGGFFSVLLSHPELDLLSGVCHGPQYGEDREVKPVGGGLPTAKYYLRPLHQRLKFAEAVQALRADNILTDSDRYLDSICECPTCQNLIDQYGIAQGFAKFGDTKPVVFQRQGSTVTMEYPVREAQELSTSHYMYTKDWEFSLLENNSLDELCTRLTEYAEHYNPRLGRGDASYLEAWAEVLNGGQNGDEAEEA